MFQAERRDGKRHLTKEDLQLPLVLMKGERGIGMREDAARDACWCHSRSLSLSLNRFSVLLPSLFKAVQCATPPSFRYKV